MMNERMPWLAALPLLAITLYFLHGVLDGGVGAGMGRLLLVAVGIGMALWAPKALHGLGRIRFRAYTRYMETLRNELAVQTSAQGVAMVLGAHVCHLTGARAASVHLGAELLTPMPQGEPSERFSLEVQDRPIGEVRCYGNVRNRLRLARLLRFGAVVLQNAHLAEQASAAESARMQAQAQRDLQYRLTWTVTTQLRALLDETRERLETVRLCAETMPPELLTKDLDSLADRLRQLEAFVHDNLRNANAGQLVIPDEPLARLARPR
ncbi:MAG TPA: hypothetical protein V6D05_13630 [Stenomitos sp.]